MRETTKPSPFNRRENEMLYIGESVPYPPGPEVPTEEKRAYIEAVADEVEKLITAKRRKEEG